MPYINKVDRLKYDEGLLKLLEPLVKKDFPEGDLNYIITVLMREAWQCSRGYKTINKLKGALGCAWEEFDRRIVGPYEQEKIKENGDVY